MEIGVVASTHEDFLAWVHDECKFPPSLYRADHHTFTTPVLNIRYLPNLEAARDIRFNLIVLTGRYADKWSDDDIDSLHHNLR